MIESPRSNHSIVKANARHATLALLIVPAHGIDSPLQNSASHILQANMNGIHQWTRNEWQTAQSKPGYSMQSSPCWLSTSGTTQMPITNQNLPTSIANAHISRIMHLCMHVGNPRMGRNTPNHRRHHEVQTTAIINRIRSPFDQSQQPTTTE